MLSIFLSVSAFRFLNVHWNAFFLFTITLLVCDSAKPICWMYDLLNHTYIIVSSLLKSGRHCAHDSIDLEYQSQVCSSDCIEEVGSKARYSVFSGFKEALP